jgi:hypothetical protein
MLRNQVELEAELVNPHKLMGEINRDGLGV